MAVTEPEGVRLIAPDGEEIECSLFRLSDDEDGAVWEVMPHRIPHDFGVTSGWQVKAAVLPARTSLVLHLPYEPDPNHWEMVSVEEEDEPGE